jgi:hypothetical protein
MITITGYFIRVISCRICIILSQQEAENILSDLSKQLLLGGYNNVKKEKTEYCRKEEK